jgi:hypothetical protein
MGKKIHHDHSKVNNMDDGNLFVQLTYELINSTAWKKRSINCIRLIDALMLENIRHKGYENGNLYSTYDDLEEFGLSRGKINEAICEAEKYGLIDVRRGKQKGCIKSECNRFRLTFLRHSQYNETTGQKEYVAPTNEWRSTTTKEVMDWRRFLREQEDIKKQKKKRAGQLK